MAKKRMRYIYEVPIRMTKYGIEPRTPKHIGFIAKSYNHIENMVLIEVSLAGHKYLKQRKYAKRRDNDPLFRKTSNLEELKKRIEVE